MGNTVGIINMIQIYRTKIVYYNIDIINYFCKYILVEVRGGTTNPHNEPFSKIISYNIKFLQNSYFHYNEPIY